MTSMLASDIDLVKENVLPLKSGRDAAGERFVVFFEKQRCRGLVFALRALDRSCPLLLLCRDLVPLTTF